MHVTHKLCTRFNLYWFWIVFTFQSIIKLSVDIFDQILWKFSTNNNFSFCFFSLVKSKSDFGVAVNNELEEKQQVYESSDEDILEEVNMD